LGWLQMTQLLANKHEDEDLKAMHTYCIRLASEVYHEGWYSLLSTAFVDWSCAALAGPASMAL
jgi:hypothetical protein